VKVFIFPGLGLGATLCGSKKITDRMLYCAAEALAKVLTEEELASGRVFPSVSKIRDVSLKVAIAIINEADRDGLRTKLTDKEMANLEEFIKSKMYDPVYVPLVEKREVRI